MTAENTIGAISENAVPIEEPIADLEISALDLLEIFNRAIALYDLVKISMDIEGWNIKVVDPSHVSMTEIKVSKAAFARYDVPQSMEFGIDLEKIIPILKTAKKKVVSLKVDPYKGQLSYTIPDTGTGQIPISNGDEIHNPKIPNLILTVSTVLKVDKVRGWVKYALANVADFFRIVLSSDGNVTLSANNDIEKAELKFPAEITFTGGNTEESSYYSSEYVDKILRSMPKDLEDLKISTGTNYPIRMECSYKNVETVVMLAPRIENS